MSPSEIVLDGALNETASCHEAPRRFKHLRGVQWRIDLGILPSSPSASVDDLRRVIADSRRRYAALRRQLLVDPHVSREGSPSPDIFIDNPLSENPDSMWGRFFRNAELERMVDHDLTRLYPEHGSYFQTSECQSMLRRILLLWCLKHSEYGYRQGMHELLAPLLYVLHVDTQHLAAVRKIYDDYFIDNFDGFSFHENDFTYKYDSKKFLESMEDINAIGRSSPKPSSLYELDPEIQSTILLSDAYGAEGELGVALSEKFMEHDAYCLFDALMSGSGGGVVMAEFFSQSRFSGSHSGLPPVIEASAALYHLLSIVDSSLHAHLVELGVEPQYFALRWLRVLFGREFALEDLLVIWDKIFQCSNSKFNESSENGTDLSFGVLDSSRGAFISSFAVSMILHLRSSLFATENATSCLQRLLNFPSDVNLDKLILKAKSLQSLAAEANSSNPLFDRNKSTSVRGHSLSVDLTSPNTPLNFVPHNYWEEKWRDFHQKEPKNDIAEKKTPIPRRGWTEKVKLRLSRSESAPFSSKDRDAKKDPRLVVRRSLLEDLSRQLGADEEGTQKVISDEDLNEVHPREENSEDGNHEDSAGVSGQTSLSGNPASEENSCVFSGPPSLNGEPSDQLDISESSVSSSISVDENDTVGNGADLCRINEDSTLSACQSSEEVSSLQQQQQNVDSTEKAATGSKEQKLLFSRFQRFWKFGRGGGEGGGGMASEKARSSSVANDASSCSGETEQEENADNGSKKSSVTTERETVDQNVMLSLRTLGQSMLDNIQVIESAFQQDNKVQAAGSSKSNNLVGKGQVTAMAALKELRKISNLLSEM